MAIADVGERTIGELVSLSGKAAVVTGAARGIGEAIARRFAEAGALVMIADLDPEAVERAAHSVNGGLVGGEGSAVAAALDVTDEAQVVATADRAMAELGGLDVWVNNAGVYPSAPALDTTTEEWTG